MSKHDERKARVIAAAILWGLWFVIYAAGVLFVKGGEDFTVMARTGVVIFAMATASMAGLIIHGLELDKALAQLLLGEDEPE